MPGDHVTTLYDTLNEKEASILSQLRSGHARTNGFLFKIGIADSAECNCGHGTESVRHFLLYCPRYTAQRQTLADKLGPRFGNMSHMLGGRNSHARTGHVNPDGPVELWKPDMEMVRAVIRYAADTGRLLYQALEKDGASPPEVAEAGGEVSVERLVSSTVSKSSSHYHWDAKHMCILNIDELHEESPGLRIALEYIKG
jgi:hypothetical protein